MVSSTFRAVSGLLVGLVPGVALGFLFAPDPTGLAPFAFAAVIAVVVGGYLYRSDWLRDSAS
jgi:ABC-type nitrate/sulfonate/bicarbonate transport system permease component